MKFMGLNYVSCIVFSLVSMCAFSSFAYTQDIYINVDCVYKNQRQFFSVDKVLTDKNGTMFLYDLNRYSGQKDVLITTFPQNTECTIKASNYAGVLPGH